MPDNAKLREVSLTRRGGKSFLNIVMASNMPIPKDQHVSVEVILAQKSDPDGLSGAMHLILS